jgi:hypothetical protein
MPALKCRADLAMLSKSSEIKLKKASIQKCCKEGAWRVLFDEATTPEPVIDLVVPDLTGKSLASVPVFVVIDGSHTCAIVEKARVEAMSADRTSCTIFDEEEKARHTVSYKIAARHHRELPRRDFLPRL